MKKKGYLTQVLFLLLILGFIFSVELFSQEVQSGSLRGKVVDENGQPLPGVSITISGPALIGTFTTVTNEEGIFRAPYLRPGKDYEIKAELQGFTTVIRKGIIINAGTTVSIELEMKQAPLAEEVTVVAASPTVDVVSSKTSTTLTSEIITSLPLSRNPSAIISVAPGTLGTRVHASGRGEITMVMDGIHMNDPDQNATALGGDVSMAWDMVEEVEIITTGASAQFYAPGSGIVNVVTKSGGNNFSGEASVYYTGEDLVKSALSKEELAALNLPEPSAYVYSYDASFSLGGPIIKDKIWFMAEFRHTRSKRTGDFRPTIINGKEYKSYDRVFPDYVGFLKVSGRVTNNIRVYAMGHFSMADVPYYYGGWWLTNEANRHNTPRRFNYSGGLNWVIDNNTFFDIRAGGLYFKWEGRYTKEADPNSPYFTDSYTGYAWGNCGAEQYTYKPTFHISAVLTKFQDDFLGVDHEFKAGIEAERNRGDWGFYMKNPITWYCYNGNPYYYRGLFGIDHPDPVYGDGRLTLHAIGATEGSSYECGITFRVGGFLQDTITYKRLNVNLGVRFDTLRAWSPGRTKGAAGSELVRAIGEACFVPEYGLNPFDEIEYETWDDAFPYGVFISPRIGVSYDLFGNGRTAIKASFSRNQVDFPTGMFSGMYPLTYRTYGFNWWDLNGNGQPDIPGIDKYESTGGSPLEMLSDAYKYSIDPNVKIPYINEFTVGIDHELVEDFRLSLRYVRKERKRMMGSVLYDLESGRYWYTYEKAPEWWVPFTTTVPAYGIYPEKTVTMYFQSKDAPGEFYRLTNIPEAKSKIDTLQIAFDKRMAKGWQLGGSVDFYWHKANYSMGYNTSFSLWKFTNPNTLINSYGRRFTPLVAKLFGTIILPYNIMMAFRYEHSDGWFWGRSVTVVPPSEWAEAHNCKTWSYGVALEPPDTRKGQSSERLDVKLQKNFKLGPGELGFYVDIFNVLARYTINISTGSGGTWRPADENTTEGYFARSAMRLNSIGGTRTLRFSILYRF